MADRYLLESGSPDGYLLEDSSGVLSLEAGTVQWSISDTTPGVALSNTNLTADIVTGFNSVRANLGGAGKFYFEVRVDAVGSTMTIGVADASSALSINWMGDSGVPNGATMGSDASSHFNGTNGVSFSYTTADVIGVAVDAPNKLVWWSKNNVWQLSGDPVAGTGGVSISTVVGSVYPVVQGNNGHETATGRFSAASQTYAAPSGFTALEDTTTPALTGQSITATLGSVLAATALALSGAALTGSQGSVAPQSSFALSGQSLAAAQGSATGSVTVALTGQSLSVGQGSVVGGQPATGQATSVAQGTAAPGTSVALTGQSLSVARGVVAPASSPSLSGQAFAVGQGSANPAPSFGLSGQALSAARGSVSPAPSPALSGQATTVAQGSTAPTVSVGISGQSLTAARGTVTVGSSNVTAALTGLSISVASGALAPSASLTLASQSLTVILQGTVIPSISLSIIGQTLAVSQGAMIVPVGGHIKVDLGSMVAKPVKVWDGISWVTKPLKWWTGTAWRITGY